MNAADPSCLAPEALELAHALHAQFYADPAWLEAEQRHVFAASWQLVAHAGDLENAGDHVVCDIAGKPVIVVRQESGELHAFYNVCRHRAGPLALCNGRGAKALHCKYHGWTYRLDGQLRTAPEMAEAQGLDIASIRLPRVQVRQWQGLVFVALADDVAPFDDVYAGIVERIAPVDIGGMKFAKRFVYEVDCNWKVYIDNFLEGYHLPHVHAGLSKVLDYRAYNTELQPWYSLQHSPLRANDGIYGEGDAYYYFVYPNVMLNIMPGRMQTNVVIPLGLERCRIEFDYYYAPTDDALARADKDLAFSDEIQQEDINICMAVQRGLDSGTYTGGRLSPKRESGVWHFQNLLRAAYRRAVA